MRYRWSLDVIICRVGLTFWTTVTENGLALPVFSFRCSRLISSWLILTSILASPRRCGQSIDSCQWIIVRVRAAYVLTSLALVNGGVNSACLKRSVPDSGVEDGVG